MGGGTGYRCGGSRPVSGGRRSTGDGSRYPGDVSIHLGDVSRCRCVPVGDNRAILLFRELPALRLFFS